MKDRFSSPGTAAALWVLVGLVLIHLVLSILMRPEAAIFLTKVASVASRGDAPAWVQAVGSIVAIFAAIGVAMWQRKASNREAEVRARAAANITAVSLLSILAPVIGTLKGCRESNAAIGVDEAIVAAKKTHRALSHLAFPTEEQLMTLHFVLPDVATDVAVSASRLRDAVAMIGLVVQSEDLSGPWALDRLRALDAVLNVGYSLAVRARAAMAAFVSAERVG